MATIGTFTAHEDGYIGTVRTLTVNVKVRIVPNEIKASDNAPDFRIFAGKAERRILSGSGRRSEVGRELVSIWHY